MTRRTPRTSVTPQPGTTTRYRDRIFDEKKHDPYQEKGKYKEPTACSDCQAVFRDGRWQWASVPQGAHAARCPACRRTHDKLPAGFLTLDGGFFKAHREEVLALIAHAADRERAEHPLHRIIQIDEGPDRVVVTTTDIHSPQRIAEALKHAFHGDVEIRYGHDEYMVRVKWRR